MTHVVDGSRGNIIENWRELAGNKRIWSFLGWWKEVIWRIEWRGRPHSCNQIRRRLIRGLGSQGGFDDMLTEEGQ